MGSQGGEGASRVVLVHGQLKLCRAQLIRQHLTAGQLSARSAVGGLLARNSARREPGGSSEWSMLASAYWNWLWSSRRVCSRSGATPRRSSTAIRSTHSVEVAST